MYSRFHSKNLLDSIIWSATRNSRILQLVGFLFNVGIDKFEKEKAMTYKISNYFFPNVVILKITLSMVLLTFESVNEMRLMCDHSMKITENFSFALYGNSNFVCLSIKI